MKTISQKFRVGDLVVCNCENDSVWYKGRVGTLIGFDYFGKYSTMRGDPLVMYAGATIRLSRSSLEVVGE